MLSVMDAAASANRSPQTIRRWIREGRLPAQIVAGRYLIDGDDLDELDSDALPAPAGWDWDKTSSGDAMPNVVAAVRRSRRGH